MRSALESGLFALLAISGWGTSCLLVVRLRRTRDAVDDAVHELARPLTALSLGFDSRAVVDRAAMAGEVERARAALGELSRCGLASAQGESSDFDLGDLAREISAAWAPVARSRSRNLVAEVTCESPVHADRGRIGQAACSLVANAIEHGEGAIRLRVTRDSTGSWIEVSDAGGGGDPRRSAGSGRGRGLALARRAVDESGGALLYPGDLPGGGYAIRFAHEGEREIA